MFTAISFQFITKTVQQPAATTDDFNPGSGDSSAKKRALENQLILAAKGGDVNAFNRLVTAYQDKLYWWVLSLVKNEAVADDITQITFITAFEKLATFRGDSFRAWLFRIARNRSFDELRRNKHSRQVSLDAFVDENDDRTLHSIIPDPAMSPEKAVIESEQVANIYRLLNMLPEIYRKVIQLVDIHGLDYCEAADLLSLPVGTVKSRLARARVKFRESFLEYEKQ